MPRVDSTGLFETVESPRRPLQRSPHPSPSGSPVGAGGRNHFSMLHRSPQRSAAPAVRGSPHDFHSAIEVTFLTQRMTSLEERFVGLESLVSRLAGKLDTFLRTAENDRQSTEALEIRMSNTEDQLTTVQKATLEFTNRVADQQRAVDGVLRHGEVVESTGNRVALWERRVDDLHRQLRVQSEDSARQADTLRSHIAQSTRLLQSYSRRQCEALSTEHAARLDSFEHDRHELIQQVAEVTHGVNETRVALGEVRSQLSVVDRNLRHREEAEKQHSEDIKVLQRRLLSALRHLSCDASAYLVTTPSPHAGGAAGASPASGGGRGRLEEGLATEVVGSYGGSPRREVSAQVAPYPAKHLSPLRGTETVSNSIPLLEDEGIDQFLAELNFLSRNAV